jgi:hypothetical protein
MMRDIKINVFKSKIPNFEKKGGPLSRFTALAHLQRIRPFVDVL